MLPTILAVLIVLAAAAGVVAVRRRRDPLLRRFEAVASRRRWRRLDAAEATTVLERFDDYIDDDRRFEIGIGGDTPSGAALAASLGATEIATAARPYIVAAVVAERFAGPPIQMDPRSVRTVRVVTGAAEVNVADPRMMRGWRITSPDPEGATALLDHPDVGPDLVETLHRPAPWIFAVRAVPGAVAVHLSRPDEVPIDADDLERLVALAVDIAGALQRR